MVVELEDVSKEEREFDCESRSDNVLGVGEILFRESAGDQS